MINPRGKKKRRTTGLFNAKPNNNGTDWTAGGSKYNSNHIRTIRRHLTLKA